MIPCHPAQPCQLWCPRTFPCKGKLFAALSFQHRLPARPTAAWPVPYGGIGCHSCIGEQENVESRCERGLLWVANCYESWVYDDVFIWFMLTIDLCYQFYGLMIVRRKEKHKDPKLRYWRVVFHLPFSLGSMPQVLGSARLLLCLQSDLEWHYQMQMGCPAVGFNWIGDTSCAKELL